MLREELLQSKNDEIARCLLSRKRKLSELYFATVGFPGATDCSPQSTLYRQKEQAFLDANDITKGRYYREDTLPSRPNVAIISPVHSDAESSQGSVESKVADRSVDTSGAESGLNVAGAADASRELPDGTSGSQQPQEPLVEDAVGARSLESVNRDVASAQTPTVPVQTSGKLSIAPVQPQPTSSNVSRDHRMEEKPGDSSDLHVREPASDAHPPTSASLKSVSEVTDRDEASSVPSSRTSAATERTPISSPAKGSSDTLIGEKPTSNIQREPYSGGAEAGPPTPDEQLKLEAAQSMQKAAEKTPVENELPKPAPAVGTTDDVVPVSADSKALAVDPKAGGDSLVKSIEPLTPASDAVGAGNGLPQPDGSRKVQSSIPSSQQTPAQAERMTTRVSSGAIRHKSVSEILGGTPKSSEQRSAESPLSDSNTSGLINRLRTKDQKGKGKERSKLSTVVFPKTRSPKSQSRELARRPASADLGVPNGENDYMLMLYQARAFYPPRKESLSQLLASANKTLSTSSHMVDYREQMDTRTLRRIQQLQNLNRWPLRQIQRSAEPARPGTHWDVLLDHMKWMRTDFREERKWKIAAAKSCADWCAEYVASDAEERTRLRVNARPPPLRTETDSEMRDVSQTDPTDDTLAQSHPTPDLIPSTEDDSVSEGFDDVHSDFPDAVVPAAIFSLGSEEFTFQMDRTPTADKLLDELPLYTPITISPETNLPSFKGRQDADWLTEILPVSKYAVGRLEFKDRPPKRKRSRYDYGDSDDEGDMDCADIPPEQKNVALFHPDNKHIRDRIQLNQSFRPPLDTPMPTVGFFESRQSSQWTYAEDDELRRLVKEYSFNWPLISTCLTSQSPYTSGPDRRTPWECFERWVGLEGLPADVAKTPFFRAYSLRLETAQRNILAVQQAAVQQQQQQQQQQQNQGQGQQINNSAVQALLRRRTTQPVRVDRKRSGRHLALLDGMRKVSKKREATLQRQQNSQSATMRKVAESNHPRPPVTTPAEFSGLKHERDLKLQEKQEQYRQHMLSAQRAALAQRAAAVAQHQNQQGNGPNQMPQVNGAVPSRGPNGIPQNVGQGMPGGVPPVMPNGMPANGAMNRARPHPTLQGLPNGAGVNGPIPPGGMPMKMMPQAGIQQAMNGRPGVPQASPDNARIMREAGRLQEQQRIVQQSRQQHQFQNQQPFIPQGPHSSPNMNMANVNPNPNNPAMMSTFQANPGAGSPSYPSSSVMQNVSSASPRMNQPNPLSNPAMPSIASIQNTIQRSNPNMPAEQVTKLATERLHHFQQQRMSQVAMNAAAGNMGSIPAGYQVPNDGSNMAHLPQANMNNGATPLQTSQAQGYSPLMRVTQSAQPNRMNIGSPAMNGMVMQQSRSATPQNHRSGSAQAPGPGSNQSPRPPQAQMANG